MSYNFYNDAEITTVTKKTLTKSLRCITEKGNKFDFNE